MHTSSLPSIRSRLTLWLLGVSLVFAVVTAGAVWFVMNHEMDEMMNQELRESGELVYHLISKSTPEALNRSDNMLDSEYEEHLIWQLINNKTLSVVAKSRKAPPDPILTKPVNNVIQAPNRAWHVVTFNVKYPEPSLLVVAQSDAERDEAKQEGALYAFMSAALSGILVSLLLNWRIKKELLPLHTLTDQVRLFDPTSPATNIDSSLRRELEPIEQSIRDLGRRLAQRTASEKAFVAHAAHALRTPVAGIDAQLAIAQREANDKTLPRIIRARAASQRLRYVMQALLFLFRSGMEPKTERLNLSDFIQKLEFPNLVPTIQKGETLTIDPDLFAAVLFNLIDNADSHHASRVDIRLSIEEGWHLLELQDDGNGCIPERLNPIREALNHQDYRPETGLKGLGLVLADLVMRAHHGHLVLPDSQKGFCVQLRWPV
jgi:signal transduction histidine kinase